MSINKSLSYEDVMLIPGKSLESRANCDTKILVKGKAYDIPVIPSNMKSVIDNNTCHYLYKNNIFYIMHRFYEESFENHLNDLPELKSISVGISNEWINRIKNYSSKIDFITIDIANAYSDNVKKIIETIREFHPETFLIVGNVATYLGASFLLNLNVDAIKVGIAQGKVCTTKNGTGFGVPMITSIKECKEAIDNYWSSREVNFLDKEKPLLIADGGIRETGDIAKALAFGADMVMAGSLFAGYSESAGSVLELEDRKYKEYFGSASKYSKTEHKHIEGKKILIPFKGDMDFLLRQIKENLQSSLSYAGVENLSCFDISHIGYYEV